MNLAIIYLHGDAFFRGVSWLFELPNHFVPEHRERRLHDVCECKLRSIKFILIFFVCKYPVEPTPWRLFNWGRYIRTIIGGVH